MKRSGADQNNEEEYQQEDGRQSDNVDRGLEGN